MKKLFIMLTVLLWTVPAFAVEGESVDFSIADNPDGTITISYQVMDTSVTPAVPKTDGTNPIGIALRLNVDAVQDSGDVTSSGSSGYTIANEAAVTAVTAQFDTFLDSAWDEEVNGDGYTLGEGSPLAKWIVTPGVDKGPAVLPASKVALCMGHLRDSVSDPVYAGPASENLVTIALTGSGGTYVVLDIDSDRGGVTGSPLITNLPIEVGVDTVISCFQEGYTDASGYVVNAAEVVRYNALTPAGKACWCLPCFGCGDGTGDGLASSSDVYLIVDAFSGTYKPYGDGCGDFNYDGIYSSGDVYRAVDAFSGTYTPCPCP